MNFKILINYKDNSKQQINLNLLDKKEMIKIISSSKKITKIICFFKNRLLFKEYFLLQENSIKSIDIFLDDIIIKKIEDNFTVLWELDHWDEYCQESLLIEEK